MTRREEQYAALLRKRSAFKAGKVRLPYEPVGGARPRSVLRPPAEEDQPALMRIGVVGTPCGGTRYTAHVLQAAGLKVGHEKMLADGICGGMHFLGLNRWAFEKYKYDVFVRLIRHPLKVLVTLPFIWIPRNRGVSWAPEREGEPANVPPGSPSDIELALRWWVLTHEKLQGEEDYLVRVSHIDQDLEKVLTSLGTSLPEKAEVPPPRSKTRRITPAPTWSSLYKLSPEWTDRAKHICDFYDLDS